MSYASIEEQREYQRNWVANRRKSYLADKSCVVCGSVDRLEVDHIDPATKISHNIWSWSESRREQELTKCQILCYTHHKEKTLSQRHRTDHGRERMYNVFGCRCVPCRKAKSIANAKRQRQPLYG